MPTAVGIYSAKCMESKYTEFEISIYMNKENNQLIVSDADLFDEYPLDKYHAELTDLSYKKNEA